MTLADRLEHVAVGGFQFEICQEAADEIRRLEVTIENLRRLSARRALGVQPLFGDDVPIWLAAIDPA